MHTQTAILHELTDYLTQALPLYYFAIDIDQHNIVIGQHHDGGRRKTYLGYLDIDPDKTTLWISRIVATFDYADPNYLDNITTAIKNHSTNPTRTSYWTGPDGSIHKDRGWVYWTTMNHPHLTPAPAYQTPPQAPPET